VETALRSASFGNISVFDEFETEHYADVYTLMRAVHGIGAGSAAGTGSTGLAGRSILAKMAEIYLERYGNAVGVPATYHVLFGSGTKDGSDQSRRRAFR
jgi:hypothetical protein